MNTLTLTNELIAEGLNRGSSEKIAQAINEHQKEIATKKDLQAIKKDLYILGVLILGLMAYGFNHFSSLINTIITKLG